MNQTSKQYYSRIKRLKREADKLYQQVCLKLSPLSMASGQKAEVTHHFCPKSLSNALRYDILNGITLTNREHFLHHSRFDPVIYEQMTKNKSAEWFATIKATRDQPTRFTLEYLQATIDVLKKCQE